MVGFAGGDLSVIKYAGPLGAGDRTGSQLGKRLAQEGGACPADMHPPRVPAALSDWGNARVSLHLTDVGVAVALGAERHDQTGLQGRTRSGQSRK